MHFLLLSFLDEDGQRIRVVEKLMDSIKHMLLKKKLNWIDSHRVSSNNELVQLQTIEQLANHAKHLLVQ